MKLSELMANEHNARETSQRATDAEKRVHDARSMVFNIPVDPDGRELYDAAIHALTQLHYYTSKKATMYRSIAFKARYALTQKIAEVDARAEVAP